MNTQKTLVSKLKKHASQFNTKHSFRFPLILLGKLFIQQYRIVQFLGPCQIYLRKMIFTDKQEYYNLYFHIFETNQLVWDRKLRIETFAKIQQKIGSIPSKGSFKILFIYLDNSTFSYFKQDQLNNSIVCQVQKLKNNLNLEGVYKPRKSLNPRETGILLHQIVQNYIYGAGFLINLNLKSEIFKSKIAYNLDKVINTINYIIGSQMLSGGYQKVSTQKELQCNSKIYQKKNSNNDHKKINFNKLDLILRNEDKVLVIDWKFTRISAVNYMKSYQNKIQKYLLLAKKYFCCQVEFHLYCIHSTSSNLMHLFTMAKKEKYIPVLEINEQQDDDMQSIIWQNQLLLGENCEEQDQHKNVESQSEIRQIQQFIIDD